MGAHTAVLHDFQHPWPMTAGKKTVHGIHKAVAVQAACQENGQSRQNGNNDCRRVRTNPSRKPYIQHLPSSYKAQAQYGSNQREIAHAAAASLFIPKQLSRQTQTRQKLQSQQKIIEHSFPPASPFFFRLPSQQQAGKQKKQSHRNLH